MSQQRKVNKMPQQSSISLPQLLSHSHCSNKEKLTNIVFVADSCAPTQNNIYAGKTKKKLFAIAERNRLKWRLDA